MLIGCLNWSCLLCLVIFYTPDLVLKYIRRLKTSSSAGPDGLPAVFYKETGCLIALPLSMIFNFSLQEGVIPDVWKLASVVPVFKKGQPGDPGNYRPISLTCIACKLMECGIKDTLMLFMINCGILNASQHGFMMNKSTTTQLLECNFDWNVAIKNKHNVDVVYLDFAKAFDSVVHSKLVAKLRSYGVSEMILRWIDAFLSNRFQYVCIDSCVSGLCSVISGVPQGSVLGPVLFIVYVNDISDCIVPNVTVKLFADDTKLYTVISKNIDNCAQLQLCLDSIASWAEHWQLKLSPKKCAVMHITPKRANAAAAAEYTIGCVTLPVVDQFTDLGVSYDNHLCFSSHIDKIVSKASSRARLILKCFCSRDSVLLTRAYCTYVRPLLEFSSVIWSPHTKKDIDRIESVQRKFTKAVYNLRGCTYEERMLNLGLDSLLCRRIKADLILCYKMLHGLVYIDPACSVVPSQYVYTRGHSAKLVKFCVATDKDKYFFTHRVVNVWNALPDFIVSSSSLDSFKRKLHEFDLSVFTSS